MEKNDNVRMSEDFFRLLRRSSARCGGAALFGEELSAAAPAVRQSFLPHSAKSHYYFEFPLIGHPCLDIMIQYKCGKLLRDMQLVENDVFGYGDFIAACAAREEWRDYLCFFAFDLSRGVQKPNIYLMPSSYRQAEVDYVPRMLELLREEHRTEQAMRAFATAPAGWQPYYAGLMGTRQDAPLRLGFVTKPGRVSQYAADPSRLVDDFNVFYPGGLPVIVADQLSALANASVDHVWDIQINQFPDGSFDDNLGITPDMGFSYGDVRQAEKTMADQKVARVMQLLEDWHIADDRWHLMGTACYGVQCVAKRGKGRRLVADAVQLNAVKARFRRTGAYLAKGYLIAATWDLSY